MYKHMKASNNWPMAKLTFYPEQQHSDLTRNVHGKLSV